MKFWVFIIIRNSESASQAISFYGIIYIMGQISEEPLRRKSGLKFLLHWLTIIIVFNFFTPIPVTVETHATPSGSVFYIHKSENPFNIPLTVVKPIVKKQVKIAPQVKKYIPPSKPASSFRIASTAVGNTYYRGFCTWYVKNKLSWIPNHLGNANKWLVNAPKYGLKLSHKPIIGSVMVTNEGNIGHTAVVERVAGGKVHISEMNFEGWAVRSTRVLNIDDKRILGYIYK